MQEDYINCDRRETDNIQYLYLTGNALMVYVILYASCIYSGDCCVIHLCVAMLGEFPKCKFMNSLIGQLEHNL